MTRGTVSQIVMLGMVILMMAIISRLVLMVDYDTPVREWQTEMEDILREALEVGPSEVVTAVGGVTVTQDGISYSFQNTSDEQISTSFENWLVIRYNDGYWHLTPLISELPEDFRTLPGTLGLSTFGGLGQWEDAVLFEVMPFQELAPGRHMFVRWFEKGDYPYTREYLFMEFFVE